MVDQDATVSAVLDRHGQTFAAEIGFDPSSNRPADLFQLLTASLLFSARIGADLAVRAAQALAAQGWRTADRMAEATWEQRTKTLNEAGYARFDERTSTMLGETAELVRNEWGGDLRNLREQAEREVSAERRLLKRCKGVGDAGVDIFFREAQAAWPELAPFVDKRASKGAKELGLPTDADKLARLVDDKDFPRLAAALVRVTQAGDADELRQ